MKTKDIETAIAAGTPLALRPKPREQSARRIDDMQRKGTGWLVKADRCSRPGYDNTCTQSARIVTLANAEAECAANTAHAKKERDRAQLAYTKRHNRRLAAIVACRLIERLAPSARVDADGYVVLSPEDATKLAGLLWEAGS